MSIVDPKETSKNPAAPRDADIPSEQRARSEADRSEQKRSEEEAHERAMVASLRRATDTAKRLAESRGEPKPTPALALRGDGKTLLSIAYVDGADLTGRDCWIGITLTEEEASAVLERVSGACDEAAAHAALQILRKKPKK